MAKQTPMVKIIVTAVITVFLDIALVYLGTLKQFHLGWAIGSAGIVTFFGMMILNAFLESGTDIFNKNCIRKSIAAGFLCMYFVFVALLSFEDTQITDVIIIQPMISHFTYLVGQIGRASCRETV